MSEIGINRRSLLKQCVTVTVVSIGGAVLLNPLSVLAETGASQTKPIKFIDPVKNATARQLKYTHDATKSARKFDYADCGNCQMFRPKTEVEGVAVGGCNMIGGGYVKATGWCTSWVGDSKKLKKQ